MTSPWLERIALKGLMCLLESYWLAALATMLLLGSLGAMLGLTVIALVTAAGIALVLREGWITEKAAQIASATLLLVLMTLLIVPHVRATETALFGYTVGAVLFSGLVVWLGVGAGRTRAAPEELLARALRVGVMTFLVLLLAHQLDPTRVSAVPIVVATLLTAVVMLAVGRLVAVIGVAERRQRRLLSFWVVAVAVVTVLILIAAAGLAGTFDSKIITAVVGSLGAGLRRAWDVIAYGLAALAYVFTRIIYWFAQLLHVHPPRLQRAPGPLMSASPRPKLAPNTGWDAALYRWLGRALVVFAFVSAALWFVLKIVRRARERGDEGFIEERDYLISAADVARAAGGKLRAAMQRIARLREARPRDPNEALRREYRALERGLAPLGVARAAGTTARAFLLAAVSPAARTGAAAARQVAGPEAAPAAVGVGGPEASPAAVGASGPAGALADALATAYERARYSRAGVEWPDVEAFRAARMQLLAALPG